MFSKPLQHKANLNLSHDKVNIYRLGTPLNPDFTLTNTDLLVHKHRLMRHQMSDSLKNQYSVIAAGECNFAYQKCTVMYVLLLHAI
jgi:hypothetical protein